MGGVIGNNATGAHSILYGMSADHLIEADVILSDGSLAKWGEIAKDELGRMKDEMGANGKILSAALRIREEYSEAIVKKYPKAWRNSAGYRLNYLFPFSHSRPPRWEREYPNIHPSSLSLHPLLAGSEGTLAVIRRAKVNLVRKPKHTILGVLAYESIASACDDVPRLLEFQPSAIELIPRMILLLARSVPAYGRQTGWIGGDPAAVLVIEFSGDQPSALKEAVRFAQFMEEFAIRQRFRGANPEIALWAQGIMKQFKELALDIALEVDQQITTHNQIQLGKRRIFEQVMRGKDDQLAQLALHLIATPFLRKKAG